MYRKLPQLVFGFHGCNRTVFERVLYRGAELRPSTNDYDWLGGGIFFWEQNYQRALSWAQEQASRGRIEEPAVIGAVIDLGNCLNLTDSRCIALLKDEYDALKQEYESLGHDLPENSGRTEDKLLRKLDCAVVEHLHGWMDELVDCGIPGAE